MSERAWDLEDRLLEYAAMIVRLAEGFPKTPVGRHVGDHLLRSGTSPLFHHGEAEAADLLVEELLHPHRIPTISKKIPIYTLKFQEKLHD